MEHDDIVAAIVADLAKNNALPRKHASFWNFFRKSPKELGIFDEVITRVASDYGGQITGWQPCSADPPDITFEIDGKKVGVEMTELVNERAILAQIANSPEYSAELLRFSVPEVR